MTKINLEWNGLPYVSFDDYTTIPNSNRKDIEKLLHLTGADRRLGQGLPPTVDDKFNNYSFFITLSMKSIIDVNHNADYYKKLIKWMYANNYITDYAFYFELYNDKQNIHCHGVFNSALQKEHIRKGIRKYTLTFYKDKTIPKTSIMLKRISEYRPADYRITLQYCRKDKDMMAKLGYLPMEKIHSNTINI